MGCLLLLILLILVFGGLTWFTIGLTLTLFGLLVTLFVAGLVGWAADLVVPGQLPGGWLGAVLAGLAGGVIGHFVFHLLGWQVQRFAIAGIDLIPAFVGAVIIAVIAELITTRRPVV
jgi:uncharacterized membrane protein YeaQ/YmgE (transglycosylase-associated protein family)